jgi:hypothetical protein
VKDGIRDNSGKEVIIKPERVMNIGNDNRETEINDVFLIT